MPFSSCAADAASIDLSIFIGRFQPFHNGHLSVIRRALASASYVLILVGSSDQPRDYFNPFSFAERKAMILACLSEPERARVLVLPQVDYPYNNQQWIIDVQDAAREAVEHFGLPHMAAIALIGHSKDKSSFYLKFFPQWASLEVPNYRGLSATPMREALFNEAALFELIGDVLPEVPRAAALLIQQFSMTPAFGEMIAEYNFVRTYKKQFASLPYPPIFTTVDACVVQSGHVLLVQRRGMPGRGLWALPGGFLNADEWVDDAVIRELREETKLKVPDAVLRGSIVTQRKFDAPFRSARGRTITFATLFHLAPATELPKVKGSDDAAKAKWVPIADIRRDMMFEDHAHIIMAFTSML